MLQYIFNIANISKQSGTSSDETGSSEFISAH